MQRIVVGVDGSQPSLAALRFAAREAQAHDARLRAVTVWDIPGGMSLVGGIAPARPEVFDDVEREARDVMEEALSAVASELDWVEVEHVVRRGQVAHVLLEEADAADLLVVGSRGRGGFAGLMLGSVSQQCAHHASCPITIVRSE